MPAPNPTDLSPRDAIRARRWGWPDYSGGSIVNLAASVFRAGGGPVEAQATLVPPLNPALDPLSHDVPGPIVIFLVDGFGWGRFRTWQSRFRGRTRLPWIERSRRITTVFPSTTTSALVSLSTASPPSWHGVVGYRQFFPRYGQVVDVLKMTATGDEGFDRLAGPGWQPSEVSGRPSLFRKGLTAVALSRDKFEGSGFTRLLYDGAEYVSYITASDFAFQLANILRRPRPPSVVYAYWDEMDTTLHLRGVDASIANLEIDRVFGLLGHAARELPREITRRVTVLVTGDHGQVRTTPDADVRVDEMPDLLRIMSRPLAGDRRAAFFAARPGERRELEAALRGHLPEGSLVLSMEAVVKAGLFGPPPYHPELAERLGDLLALVPSPAGVSNPPPGRRAGARFLYAAHGGLEADEAYVPLIAGRLREFERFGAPPRAPNSRSRAGREG